MKIYMKTTRQALYKIVTFAVISIFSTLCSYADIAVNILNLSDQQAISTDDIIELEISTNNTSANTVDLSPLTKDFKIISQGKQVSHSIINGNSSSQIKLLIGLRSKKSGTLQIPVITIGREHSKPLTIKVLNAATDPNLAKEIFMNIETDNQSVYLQSPLKITVNIYAAADITVRDLELSSPDLPDQTLFKLNETNKQVFHKNRRYNFLQVSYLAFYNKPGNISLPKFQLSGLKLKSSSNSNSSDIFALYQQQWAPFTRTNPDLKIKILDKPISFNNIPWLAADNISVEQIWMKDNSTNIEAADLREGDAIQRTITIKGINVPAEYLPSIYDPNQSNTTPKATDDGNYKIYIDKPELNNKIIDQKLQGSLSQKITYILTKSGDLALPGHKITWWNNKSKSIQYSTIESKKLHVAGQTNKQTNNHADSSLQTSNTNVIHTTAPLNNILTENQLLSSANNNKLVYLLSGLIIILLLVILYLIMILKKLFNSAHKNTEGQRPQQQNPQPTKKIKFNKIFSTIKTHAKNNDAKNTYKILCELPNTVLCLNPNAKNSSESLVKLKNKLPLGCQENINNLSSYLYGNSNVAWDSDYFARIVIPELQKLHDDLNKKGKSNQSSFSLPELYPK